jgi:hypothetical protein
MIETTASRPSTMWQRRTWTASFGLRATSSREAAMHPSPGRESHDKLDAAKSKASMSWGGAGSRRFGGARRAAAGWGQAASR